MPGLFDRIKDTWIAASPTLLTTLSTFAVTGAAPGGYQTFSTRYAISDANIPVAIVSQTSTDWMTCWCTYTSSNTLRIDTIMFSSNGDAGVTFPAGAMDIFVTPAARAIPGLREANTFTGNNFFSTGNLYEGGQSINLKYSPINYTAGLSGAVARPVLGKLGDLITAADFGAAGNGNWYYGVAAMNSGSPTLTVTGASFTAADVGKLAYVQGAGVAGATLATTVSAYISATQLTLATNASTTVTLKDAFVGASNNTAINAADAVPFAKYMTDGLYGTSVAFNTLDGPYFGKGQIVDSNGNKRAPWYSRISSAPARPSNAPFHADGILTAFNGDVSKVQIAMEHWTTGAATLGQPTTGYRHNPECSAFLVDLYNDSGYNHSPSGDDGRTMVNAFHTRLRQYGQGDIVAYQVIGIGASNNPAATNWSANPAIGAFAADVQAGINYTYLNPVEINSGSNAYLCSAVGGVFNMARDVDGEGGQAHFWSGVRINSKGTQPIDMGFQAFGRLKHGFDISYADLGANLAAFTLKANQRIYGNVTASDGASRFPTALNGDYFTYSSGISGWNFVTANQSALQVSHVQVTLGTAGQILRLPGGSSGFTALQASSTASGTLTLPAANGTLALTSNVSGSAFQPQIVVWNQTADANGPYFIVQKSRGASGAGSATQVNDVLGTYLWRAADSNGNIQNSSNIAAVATAVAAGSVSSRINVTSTGGTWVFGETGTLTNPGAVTVDNGLLRIGNNRVLQFRDVAGTGATQFLHQNDNNFVAYNAAGVPIFSFINTATPSAAYGAGAGLRAEFEASTNYIRFLTSNIEAMRIQSDQRVGIGTTGPFCRFHVRHDASGSNPATSGSTDPGTIHRINNNIVGLDTGVLVNGNTWIQSRNTTDFSINYPILLNPNGGNVGIGTLAPAYKLDVLGNVAIGRGGGTFQGISIANSDNSASVETVSFIDARNNLGTADGDMFFGHQTDGGSYIRFATTAPGSRTVDRRAERMRITPSGAISFHSTFDPGFLSVNIGAGLLRVYRQNTSGEGGQIEIARSADNGAGWYIDVIGSSTNSPDELRFVDAHNATVRFNFTARGVAGIVNDLGPVSTDTLAVGFRGSPNNDLTGNYTLALTDAGRTIRKTDNTARTVTVPADATVNFPLGTCIMLCNTQPSAGLLTITPAAGVSLIRYTTTKQASGTRTVNFGGSATLRKVAANYWSITGTGVG